MKLFGEGGDGGEEGTASINLMKVDSDSLMRTPMTLDKTSDYVQENKLAENLEPQATMENGLPPALKPEQRQCCLCFFQ